MRQQDHYLPCCLIASLIFIIGTEHPWVRPYHQPLHSATSYGLCPGTAVQALTFFVELILGLFDLRQITSTWMLSLHHMHTGNNIIKAIMTTMLPMTTQSLRSSI